MAALAHARETYEAPLPRYVEEEFRGYLRCGDFLRGFIYCRCEACGHDLVVAFSCKGRAACPSCAGRRMANVAAFLVDRVLPSVPVRQWVLSLPFELRALAAFRADVLSAPPPTREELGDVVRRVHRRVLAWLVRKGLLGAPPVEDQSQETRAQTSLEACAAIAIGRGTVRALRDDAAGEGMPAAPAPPGDESAVERDGFNLHASVAIAADDDVGRERLMRYGARPPLALDRLRRLPGGRIAYRIKKLKGGRAKSRVMTPIEFLARPASIVPPPRYPLLRYHGVLGPRSPRRRDVVPRALAAKPCDRARQAAKPSDASPQPEPASKRSSAASEHVAGATSERRTSGAALAHVPEVPSPERSAVVSASDTSPAGVLLAPNILSVKHWDRLLGGALYAVTPRVDWASLLRRSFDTDVLQCVSCGGILTHLGFPTVAPPIARARSPAQGDAAA